MRASPAVRAARKEMQLKRLEAKGKPGYAEFYANQPLQKVKAAKQADLKAARVALEVATEAVAVAEVTGVGLDAAREQQALAALVIGKLTAPRANDRAALTAA